MTDILEGSIWDGKEADGSVFVLQIQEIRQEHHTVLLDQISYTFLEHSIPRLVTANAVVRKETFERWIRQGHIWLKKPGITVDQVAITTSGEWDVL